MSDPQKNIGVQVITDADFEERVLKSENLVLVDFYADWCMPCKMLGPILHGIAEEMKDDAVSFVKLNTDQNQKYAGQLGVSGIPTVFFFKGGLVVDKFVGVRDEDVIKEMIKKNMELKA